MRGRKDSKSSTCTQSAEVDAAGIDGMSVEELGPHLREDWQRIKEALVDERYEPQPVKRVEIPKPGGGIRRLGIPTVVSGVT